MHKHSHQRIGQIPKTEDNVPSMYCGSSNSANSTPVLSKTDRQNWITEKLWRVCVCCFLILRIFGKPPLALGLLDINFRPYYLYNLPKGTYLRKILDSTIILEMGLMSELYIYRSLFYLREIMKWLHKISGVWCVFRGWEELGSKN